MLNRSPYLSSLVVQLDLAGNYMFLFDKLETLNHFSSLQLTINAPMKRNLDGHELSKSYGECFARVRSLKELQLSLTDIKQANIIAYNFMDKLKVFTQLQKLSLNFDFSNLNDEAIYRLSQSLSCFSDLKSFKFMNSQPPGY